MNDQKTSNENHFSVPEIGAWLNERQYIHLTNLLSNAASLIGDGNGNEIGDNEEYERAMVELICCNVGLNINDHRDEVYEAICKIARGE